MFSADYLSADERLRLLASCADHPRLLAFVTLAISTGMRRGEIMGLQWAERAEPTAAGILDLVAGKIVLRVTKNNTSRCLPIVTAARAALEVLPRDSNRVFPHNLRKPWERALAEARVTSFRIHDLRHTAASYLAMNGASTLELSTILGHKTLNMVKRYSHLSEAHTTAVIESMASKMF